MVLLFKLVFSISAVPPSTSTPVLKPVMVVGLLIIVAEAPVATLTPVPLPLPVRSLPVTSTVPASTSTAVEEPLIVSVTVAAPPLTRTPTPPDEKLVFPVIRMSPTTAPNSVFTSTSLPANVLAVIVRPVTVSLTARLG